MLHCFGQDAVKESEGIFAQRNPRNSLGYSIKNIFLHAGCLIKYLYAQIAISPAQTGFHQAVCYVFVKNSLN